MADDIIQFSPGGKVTAEETNENNLLLKEWALDNSQSEAYIDGKIATLTNNLNSQISSINTQLAQKANINNPTFTGKVKVPAYNGAGTALQITESGTNYIQLGDKTLIQWGRTASTNGKADVTFPKAYKNKNSYSFVATQCFKNDNSDRGTTVYYGGRTEQTITVWGNTETNYGFYWYVIGRVS